jgi:hypothetical protein
MNLRTYAVSACLRGATKHLELDQITFPNGLASDLTRYPAVADKALHTSAEEGAKLIVVDRSLIVYIEHSMDPRDHQRYECTTLPAFMRRYFARKIDLACTVEMAKLEMNRLMAGVGKLSNQEFVERRQAIESLLTERLESYLRSARFKVYKWLARI